LKRQVSIKIPKGTKCKNGTCEQDLELDTEIEIPELKPQIQVNPSAEMSLTDQIPAINGQVMAPAVAAAPEPKEKIIEKAVPPSYQPNYKCKDGKCGQNHANPNYTTMIQGKCDNCGQYGPDAAGPCFWCKEGNFEEVDPEELEELGIQAPEPVEHSHED
jgi:hypothetical protein